MSQRTVLGLLAALVGGMLLAMSSFTVREFDFAIKLRFGEIVGTDYSPGLHFKVPMVDDIRKFDRRILTTNYPAEQFLTSEGKILKIDFYIKWQISNVDRFYQASSGEEEKASKRLGEIVKDSLKGVIARRTLQQVVSAERTEFIEALLNVAATNAAELGAKIVDVRVKRIDLPDEVSGSVFNRMQQDFARQAAQLRAEGSENKVRLQAEADRERSEILAAASRDAQTIRGEADAKAAEIYAKAYSRNPEFFAFFRSMQAYRASMGQNGDVMVVSPDSDFFKYLKQANPR
jgi:modulator of FtsH protease HflC